MATLSQTLQIILTATDQTAGAIGGVANDIGKIADAGKGLTQPLADATASVGKFQFEVLKAGAQMVIFAGNEAQKFEISFREIATLIDQPIENLQTFKQGILDYAKSSTQSLDEIIRATYDAISAGVDYKKALDAVRQSEQLAIAGKTDLGSSNRVLNQILAAYAETNITAAEAADGLFTTVRTGVTTMPDLTQSIGGVVDIAAKGGVSFDELGAAIAVLTKTQDTAMAITALKGVITGIISPSVEAKAAAAALGIEFSASSLQANGLQGILQLIIEKTGGSTDKISELFGNVRGLSGVLGLATADGQKFNEALEAQKNKAGAAAEAFGKFKGTLDTGVDALRILAITLGQPVLDSFIRAKGEITNITNALSAALAPGGALAGLGGLIGDIYKDVADTLADIATNLPGALEKVNFTGFLKALEDLWSAIVRLLRVEDLRTEDGLARVIQTLVELLTRTTTFTKGAIDALGPFVAKLGEFVTKISQIDPAQIALIGELGGYALAANIGFTALAGTVLIVKGALPALAIANTAVATATGALAAGLSGGAGLVALLGPVGLGAAAVSAVASYALLETSHRQQLAITQELKEGLGPLVDEIEREAEAAKETRLRIEENLLTRRQEAETLEDVAAQTQRLTEYWKEQGFAYDTVTGAITRLADAQDQVGDDPLALDQNITQTKVWNEELGKFVTVFGQATGETVKATGAFAEVKKGTEGAKESLNQYVAAGKLTVDQLIQITKNANDFEAKMEEIASNERIKLIEAKITLDVAQLEAETKQVEAAFESINTTIEDTGKVLGELYGLWTGADSSWDKAKIEGWIRDENRRRDAAMDKQNDLIQAQIDSIKARTDAMNRGNALITVNGDGLEPHLNAFMWEVLRAIQVRASADMQEFLLGIGGAPA
jgi:TP901 family phage tail tape measure protein